MSETPTPLAGVQCTRSPSGHHELFVTAAIGQRGDRLYPSWAEIHVICRHCHAAGRAVIQDQQIVWDDAEQLPN